ncbi:unnamed protein product [Allacma fusca]|uniref:Uncharacterized protein n=1 Tax=Allacma fusca TaxID=39272 RepID=A0A8J2LN03_9HEXA|nr:unnamed protein product [Allacma fusca]
MPNTSTKLQLVYKTGGSRVLSRHGYSVRQTPKKRHLTLRETSWKRLEPVIPLTRLETSASNVPASVASTREPQRPEDVALVRNLISTILIHPNLLGHEDFGDLRRFLENLGVSFICKSTDICIPLEPSDNKPLIKLHPPLPKTELPFLCSFGFIKEMTIDAEKKCVNVHKYSLMSTMKAVLKDVLERLMESPEIMYQPSHTFLYEFMIHFGAKPRNIDEFVKCKSSSVKSWKSCKSRGNVVEV